MLTVYPGTLVPGGTRQLKVPRLDDSIASVSADGLITHTAKAR